MRILSNFSGNLNNVAFKTPDGKKVLIVENDGRLLKFLILNTMEIGLQRHWKQDR
ncbi:glycoside hydrolase family 30 beta sandwich domain-containing protein [Flavobacterium sp. GT2N3]|uniref:glycoside hydrolase family 30 beta sandwich domain-containing protein n=1 Tax=unclassified Flavobacterium TaxID=196869 RepID=UPI003AAFBCB9